MDRQYPVEFEIAGPFAMFARPDTGSSPVSYPVPTASAARGMFEAIARLANGRLTLAQIVPQRVEICCEIAFQRYVTNYGGPLREPKHVNGGDSYQLSATALVDVCYRIHGAVEPTAQSRNRGRDCHQLQSMFERRLVNGQSFHGLCLGWSEFVPSYFGPFRASTQVNHGYSGTIASLLHSVFDDSGRVSPLFHEHSEIREGVLTYGRREQSAE